MRRACTTTLRTGALALVYSAAEYASPVWCRSSHTYKLDSALNDTMRIITGCLRPTPTVFLPVLSGVEPPDVRREARVGRLVNAARTFPGHILHDCVIAATSIGRQRLKSRHSFSNHAARLLKKPFEAALAWNDRVHNSPPLLQSACPEPFARSPPGSDLPRKQWVLLNRLRSGTARTSEALARWGHLSSASCSCGHPSQTIRHIILDCPLYRAPNGFAGLRCPDEETRQWLMNFPLLL